jgi:hypothetical protein
MKNDKEQLKQLLVNLYFPKADIQNLDEIDLQLHKIDRKIFKVLWFPKRFCAHYILVARSGEITSQSKIVYKEKDAVKYFLKLINSDKQEKS